MMPVIKHFDPVVGVDIHIVVLPPGAPTPIPHPHIATILDPMDYVPVLGATVFIGPLPRASAGTAGKSIPHIPMGGPFVKPPMNEDEIFMGSATVLADGDPLSYTALPVLSCQEVGMIAPPRKKPKRSYGMVLPTSVVLGIPLGMPVLVGGPPTVNMMALGIAAGMKALGKGLKKLRALQKSSKRVKRVSNAIHERARRLMDRLGVSPNVRNRVHRSICSVTGHPVDVASGKLFTEALDFALPGPIPLKWERVWYSTSTYQGPLGHGWHHSYDLALIEDEKAVAVRLADGRPVAFPKLAVGDVSYERHERLTLLRDSRGYALDTHQGLRYRFELSDASDNRHRLQFIAHKSSGVRMQFEYDTDQRLSRIIDSGGRTLLLSYDQEGLLHKIFLPHVSGDLAQKPQCIVEYHYQQGELVRVDDALQQPWCYEYRHHLLVKETYRNGLSFYFRFDGEGPDARCVETWGDGRLYYRKLQYDLNQNSTRVENSLGHVTTYYHDGVLPHRIVDPLKNATLIEYNSHSQIVSETNALGFKKHYEYDEFGNPTKIVQTDGTALKMAYDRNHNLIQVDDVLGNCWRYEYDAHNRLLREIDPNGAATCYGYNDVALTQVTDPAGNAFYFQYDHHLNLHSIVSALGREATWEYDAHGRVVAAVDAEGNKRVFQRDALGRVTNIREADGSEQWLQYDAQNNVIHAKDAYTDVQMGYQGMGRLAYRSQGGTRIDFEYDTEEQLKSIVNEKGYRYCFELDERGQCISEQGFDGLTRLFLRDAIGQVRRIQRPDGRHSTFQYDAGGRVTDVVHHNGEYAHFEYSVDGNLIKAVNAAATVMFERDFLGRVVKEIQNDLWVKSAYDVLGNRIQMTSSFGLNQVVRHDQQGRVAEVTIHGHDSSFITQFKRDQFGAEIQRILPGGLHSYWQRDRNGRPLDHRIEAGNQTHYRKQYVWGAGNRLKKIVDLLGRETLFHHDVFGNLAAAQYGNYFDIRMMDEVGNLFRTEGKKDREYGLAGQLRVSHGPQGETRYEYDGEGNLIRKQMPDGKVWRYQWNAAGFLEAVIRPDGLSVSFQYDALGRRIRKTYLGKTTHWLWDGNQLLHEWVKTHQPEVPESIIRQNADENEIAAQQREMRLQPLSAQGPPGDIITWLFEPESFVPMAKMVGNRYFPIVSDHLGTPVAMFDAVGRSVWSAELSVWGKRREHKVPNVAVATHLLGDETHLRTGEALQSDVSDNDCPFRWPGQYEDEETGLYYNRFRYYDPEIGQYISQDPIRLAGGNPSLYGYVPDPNVWCDPLGLACNTWNEFQRAHKGQFRNSSEAAAAYRRLIRDESPWPIGYTPVSRTLAPGTRINMALSPGQATTRPGGFATFDEIPDVDYVRNQLAVKQDWKPGVDRVVTYEVVQPLPTKVGPVGPQIDKTTGRYLPGGGSQAQLDVPAADRMNYLRVVNEQPIN